MSNTANSPAEALASAVRPAIDNLPLHPKEMTELIQTINKMYSTSFLLFLGIVATIIALTAFVLYRQNKNAAGTVRMAQEEIEHSKAAVREYQEKLALLQQQTQAAEQGLASLENKIKRIINKARNEIQGFSFASLGEVARSEQNYALQATYMARAIANWVHLPPDVKEDEQKIRASNIERAIELMIQGLRPLKAKTTSRRPLTLAEVKEIESAINTPHLDQLTPNPELAVRKIAEVKILCDALRQALEKLETKQAKNSISEEPESSDNANAADTLKTYAKPAQQQETKAAAESEAKAK